MCRGFCKETQKAAPNYFTVVLGVRFTMRIPTFTESLFGIALVFLCGYFAAFNYELLGKEEVCSLDLTANHEGICQLNQKTASSVRLVVKHGGDQETVLTEVQLAVSLKSENFEFFFK
jgi:hypothetical protein